MTYLVLALLWIVTGTMMAIGFDAAIHRSRGSRDKK